MSLGIKSLTLVLHVSSSLKDHVSFENYQSSPERNKQAFQHTLFRKIVPCNIFHKRKQWEFLRTVLQINQTQIHTESYLKTNFRMYCLALYFIFPLNALRASFPYISWLCHAGQRNIHFRHST